jgi:hypothetical protein
MFYKAPKAVCTCSGRSTRRVRRAPAFEGHGLSRRVSQPKNRRELGGTGITSNIETTANRARDAACERPLQDVIAVNRTAVVEAEEALAALLESQVWHRAMISFG